MALKITALVLFIGAATIWSSTSAEAQSTEKSNSISQNQEVTEPYVYKPSFFLEASVRMILNMAPDEKRAGLEKEFEKATHMKWKDGNEFMEYFLDRFKEAMEN